MTGDRERVRHDGDQVERVGWMVEEFAKVRGLGRLQGIRLGTGL